ncbi:MAG: ABC transporter permease [Proteobacteria bacterium]|nr:ABC transporter permease [Pseudomonadota bacterium]
MFFLRGFLNFFSLFIRRPKFWVLTAVVFLTVWVVATVYGERVVLDIPVYVVDHDNSTVSRTLRQFLEASPDLHVVGALDTPEEAKDHLYEGDVAAVIYIPSGLSQAIKTQNGGTIMAYIDGTSIIAAKNVSKAVQTVVKSTSVGVSMIAVQKQGVHDSKLLGMLQPINLDVERPFNALTIYSEYLLPVLVFFCLYIFICVMTCAVYQEVPKTKITEHVIRRRYFYLGRLFGVFVLSFTLGMVIYSYCLPRVDIVLHSSPLMAMTALTVFIIVSQILFSITNLALPVTVAMTVSYLICMCSVMMAGLTWPLESMPWYIQEISSWLPLTPFLQSVQVFMYNNATWSDLSHFGWMFLKQFVVFLCIAFCIMRIKDIILFFKWLYRRIMRKRAESIEMEAVAAKEKQETDAAESQVSDETPVVDNSELPVAETSEKDSNSESLLAETSEEDSNSESLLAETSEEESDSASPVAETSEEESDSASPVAETSEEESDSALPVPETSAEESDFASTVAETSEEESDSESTVAQISEEESDSESPVEEDLPVDNDMELPSHQEAMAASDSVSSDPGERTAVIDLGTAELDESTSDDEEDKS